MNPNGSQLPAATRQNHIFFRWIKFNAVGGIGIGVQLAALTVFHSWLKVASGIGSVNAYNLVNDAAWK